ncbi:MAG: hypothetical protein HRT53_16380 [Colwellia sp.]|nr:hypothetical protein [Colwellia sp.]
MTVHELPFSKIILLSESIAEVIINEGVELDEAMVDQYHEFLLKHLSAPFSLLINKINSYSYSFAAQINLATLKEINAMAVVTYNSAAELATNNLATAVPREVEWNLKMFTSRDNALNWLQLEQKT